MAAPHPTNGGPPRPPGGGGYAKPGGLFGAAFAFGFALAAIGMIFSHLLAAAGLLTVALAAFPPGHLRRFSRTAWLTGLAIGGGLGLGMFAWTVLDGFV